MPQHANIHFLAPALQGPLACVDLETTGGLAAQHRIIEVGIVLLDGGRVVEEWSSLVQPSVRIPPAIAAFTGIDDAMVAEAPPFAAIAAEVRHRLEGRLFIAHNARFDYGFLRAEFRLLGQRLRAPVLCTVKLSRGLFPEHKRHNLDTLMERFGLDCTARHRALGDARVLPALLAAMQDSRGPEPLEAAVQEAMREPRLPPQLSPELADDLPEALGVYLFHGEGGALLYVGKSRNIRSRVFDHFAAAHRDGKEMRLARQVRDVKWIETGGEFGALLLESRLVKELAPAHNRQLRSSADTCGLELKPTTEGLQPVVVPLDADSFAPDRAVYGPFRSQRDARRALEGKAREAGLCLKVIGCESGEGSCFAFQLRKCRGACVGREPRALHDARLQLALASLRLKAWPFVGPVGIREPAPDRSGTVIHVIDRWQHLGSARDAREIDALLATGGGGAFDADGYRIVARHLQRIDPRELIVLDGSPSDRSRRLA